MPTYTLLFSGGTGDFAPMNGTITVIPVGSCHYSGSPPSEVVNFFIFTGLQDLGLSNLLTGASCTWSRPGPWDCASPLGPLPLIASSGLGTPPIAQVL